jgi:hypothetical protein
MQESGSAGNCAGCGAVRSRGAVFCWQCGAQVMERTVASGNGHRSSPHPIDALVGVDGPGGEGEIERSSRGKDRRDAAGGEEARPHEDLGRPIQTSS